MILEVPEVPGVPGIPGASGAPGVTGVPRVLGCLIATKIIKTIWANHSKM